MRIVAHRSLLVATLFAAAGCQIVHVEDTHGDPVFWAEVTTQSEGMEASSFPAMTDLFGNVLLVASPNPDHHETLIVRKEGFVDSRRPRSKDSSMTVQLLPLTPETIDESLPSPGPASGSMDTPSGGLAPSRRASGGMESSGGMDDGAWSQP
jgi:hypothetical protein